ncbi:unnamed protein product, partial [Staurois parvus]
VVASLYGTVILGCSFPFIRGTEGLVVVWEKIGLDGKGFIAHKFKNDQDSPTDQNVSYTGRTELSKEFSNGAVNLTLREVTFNDEGTYYCRAANRRGHGDKKVNLTINHLNADDSTVTSFTLMGRSV